MQILDSLDFLSELYAHDCPDAWLLSEYPSSNSDDTVFQNRTEFIIHDPFPPPPRELLTTLGPHHLMLGWGKHIPVTSQIAPPDRLLEHWRGIFGEGGVPIWREYDQTQSFITLFPHQSIDAKHQLIDPKISYALHSKEIIESIDCPQADVLDAIRYPCIVKLSHGYAGLGNFLLRNRDDEGAMRLQLDRHWPNARLVINSVIEDIVGDYGVQFYLRRDGSAVWLGLTEQQFNDSNRWCGGLWSSELQSSMIEPFEPFVAATAKRLADAGYFGLVGIDILRSAGGQFFLVDVNPRLTGITPFLMASRIFAKESGSDMGVYQASFRFSGSLDELIRAAESQTDTRVMILSAFEQLAADNRLTICHISVSSNSQTRNLETLRRLAAT